MPFSWGPVADFAPNFVRALDVGATTGGAMDFPPGCITGLVLVNFAAPVRAGFAVHAFLGPRAFVRSTSVACGERGPVPGGFRRIPVLLELRFAI